MQHPFYADIQRYKIPDALHGQRHHLRGRHR